MIGVSKKRGFVFVETIVVTAILLASLMLVYSLFVSNKNEENKRLRYDDPAKLYETYYLKQYFESFDLTNLTRSINATIPYQYIYRGQTEIFGDAYLQEKLFFSKMWEDLGVSSILVVPYDLSRILSCEGRANDLCSNKDLYAYLNTLDSSDIENPEGKYRMIVEYSTRANGCRCESSEPYEKCAENADTDPCFHFFSNVLLEPKI